MSNLSARLARLERQLADVVRLPLPSEIPDTSVILARFERNLGLASGALTMDDGQTSPAERLASALGISARALHEQLAARAGGSQ